MSLIFYNFHSRLKLSEFFSRISQAFFKRKCSSISAKVHANDVPTSGNSTAGPEVIVKGGDTLVNVLIEPD